MSGVGALQRVQDWGSGVPPVLCDPVQVTNLIGPHFSLLVKGDTNSYLKTVFRIK